MLHNHLLIRLQNVPVVVTAHGRTFGLEMEPNVVWGTRGRMKSSGEVETALNLETSIPLIENHPSRNLS